MQAVFSGSRGTFANLARIALAGFMLSICAVEASAAPILIVCIGADNTAGRGTGRRHPGGVARDQAFPAQLERLLHRRGVDAHVVTGAPDASFKHVTDTELARDLCKADFLAFVAERSAPRDNEQPRHTREIGGEVLADAVCEIALLLVVAHVGERQDCETGLRFGL